MPHLWKVFSRIGHGVGVGIIWPVRSLLLTQDSVPGRTLKRSLGYLRDILAPGFKDVCETVFIVALFRMRKDWKLHTCLSKDWFNKLSYSLTQDDYTSSIKKKMLWTVARPPRCIIKWKNQDAEQHISMWGGGIHSYICLIANRSEGYLRNWLYWLPPERRTIGSWETGVGRRLFSE